MKIILRSVLLTIIVSIFLLSFNRVGAQTDEVSTSSGVAVSLTIAGDADEGDIISSTDQGYTKAKTPYDPSIYGVVTLRPALAFDSFVTSPRKRFVASTGDATVKVTAANGPIAENDLITSSDKPGVGVKASENGTVLGVALESFSSSDPNKVGKIRVSVNPHFTIAFTDDSGGNILSLFKSAGGAYTSPIVALRYALAAGVVILSFVFGFIYFGRVATKGVESIGRNPLAGKLIEFGIFVNIVFAIGIILGGVGIAYLILII